jgi:hypothetical protein
MSAAQIRQPLPESLMKAIRATVASPDASVAEKLEAVVIMAHGYGLWAKAERIVPSDYAIPEEQWATISALLQALYDDELGTVNMALDWMNIGPSGYKP